MIHILKIIGVLIASYLLGSISFAVVFSKIFTKKDVRDFGSHNAGMTNVIRTSGVLPGILTFVFDALKSVVACLLAKYVFERAVVSLEWDFFLPIYGVILCGILCQLGHIFPIFFGFKGGKAVATTLGIGIICDYRITILAVIIFVVLLLVTKIVSISSILAVASIPFLSIVFFDNSASVWYAHLIQSLLYTVMAIIVIVKHKENIIRLKKGEEKSIFSKKR